MLVLAGHPQRHVTIWGHRGLRTCLRLQRSWEVTKVITKAVRGGAALRAAFTTQPCLFLIQCFSGILKPFPDARSCWGGEATTVGVTQACGSMSGSLNFSALSLLLLSEHEEGWWNFRINQWAQETTEGWKSTPSEPHSPSSGAEHNGGPAVGSQSPSFLGLSLSSRGLPCWKGPRTSGSTKERSVKADVS